MSGDLIIGRYRTEREIGRGGMGIVFRAYDTLLGRVVALKMLLSEPSSAESHSPLVREARAASILSHPGIATVYDFVEDSGAKFIVYEFVEGETLRKVLTETRFQTREILDVGIQLAGALSAAHGHRIVHRDIKPENTMLGPRLGNEGRPVKILDFGLAKHIAYPPFADHFSSVSTTVTVQSPGQLIGTISYMAPEQLQGEANRILQKCLRKDPQELTSRPWSCLLIFAFSAAPRRPQAARSRIRWAKKACSCDYSAS